MNLCNTCEKIDPGARVVKSTCEKCGAFDWCQQRAGFSGGLYPAVEVVTFDMRRKLAMQELARSLATIEKTCGVRFSNLKALSLEVYAVAFGEDGGQYAPLAVDDAWEGP